MGLITQAGWRPTLVQHITECQHSVLNYTGLGVGGTAWAGVVFHPSPTLGASWRLLSTRCERTAAAARLVTDSLLR